MSGPVVSRDKRGGGGAAVIFAGKKMDANNSDSIISETAVDTVPMNIAEGIEPVVTAEGLEMVRMAGRCWESWRGFREERGRCMRYTYGDQWSDVIRVEGQSMTEEDYILSQGNVPLKNNLIRRLVRNVLGVWRSKWQNPKWPLPCEDRNRRRKAQKLLDNTTDFNNLKEIAARSLEEFLISGMTVMRVGRETVNRRTGAVSAIVSPDKFFMDPSSIDPRGWDASIAGELHDMDFNALCRHFASKTGDCAILSKIYAPTDFSCSDVRAADSTGTTFSMPADRNLCRVIELWRKETEMNLICHLPEKGTVLILNPGLAYAVENENRRREKEGMPAIRTRWISEEIWHYYFLSPFGHILKSGVSPWSHRRHPFVFKAYPFIDGKIHSFVADILDQQRYTNRLISLYDWIMRASAKGVLLFPEGSLPEGTDIDDIADEWSRFNGVIVYKPRPNTPLPQQVSCNSTNIGISELLAIQLKMFEDISGVNGALQGKLANNSVSGTLFSQQTQNALTAITDLLDSFSTFLDDSIRINAEIISQYEL